MNAVVVKLDDKTLRELDELAKDSSRSEVVRKAIRQYIARAWVEKRKREVQEYMQNESARKEMSRMAEMDIEDAAILLERVEKQNND